MIPLPAAFRSLVAALAAVVLAVACGGGVDSGGTGAPVQSFAAGPISGFGSILVNGVRYDDSAAQVVDDDGTAQPRSALRLGMVVEVDAGAVTQDPVTHDRRSVAHRIQFGSAIRGPVQSVNAAASTMTVLGQLVRVDADTVFDGVSGLAGLQPGMLLDIHALLDPASGSYRATRVEREATLAEFRLRGIVSALDLAAKTFSIGNARIGFAGVPSQDLPQLADGAIVRLKLSTVQQSGLWVLSRATVGRPALPRGVEAEVEGFVTKFTGLSSFEVDGRAVDASAAQVEFKHGTAAQLANGVRVEVEGVVVDGVIVARKVSFRRTGQGDDEGDDDEDGDDDDEDDDDGKRFTLKGAIESVNVSQRSFILRGLTVVHDGETTFSRGRVGDLAAGVEVEVKGVLSGDGTRLRATKVKFER